MRVNAATAKSLKAQRKMLKGAKSFTYLRLLRILVHWSVFYCIPSVFL